MKVTLKTEPFDWKDNMSELAFETFYYIHDKLTYCQAHDIGLALAKLELMENQGLYPHDSK